jgi:hypothetical protein
MDSAVLPDISESLQEFHCVLARRLIEAIHRLLQGFHRRMPAVMTHFFLQRLPRPFLRVRFRLVGREMNHSQARMFFQPPLDFLARVVSRPVNPQDDLPTRELVENHPQPDDCRLRVLPVNAKGRHVLTVPQVQGAVNILGLLAARRISNQGLSAFAIPSSGNRAFQVEFGLVTRQRRDDRPALREFFEDFTRVRFKAGLLDLRASDVEFASALVTPAQKAQQFAHAAAAIGDGEAFLNQLPDGFQGPATAHLRARLRFCVEQRTEFGRVLLLEQTLAMLPPHSGLFFKPSRPFSS